ncbi:uncharacterized protein LOC126475532 [Schistocerca serialis cubense]|uniref:uncharacterized protein LOC126475532 n=1 Tax=Schistocerca serialis cubense TaxID=2023355 RepID=UPI00214E0FCE|nr:uncharacterized protein LOC126475532 [Schistocerca serialis cubense]
MCARFHPIHTDNFYAGGACGNVFQCSAKGSLRRFASEPKNEVNALDLNVAGDVLATGGKDANIRLYDPVTAVLTGELCWRLEDHVLERMPHFHRMRIFALRFHPQSRDLFLSAGWDDVVKEMTVLTGSWSVSGSLQLWDLRSTHLLETVVPVNRPPALNGEFLYAAQFFSGDPYGDTLLCGGSGLPAVEIVSVKQRKVLGSFRVLKAVQAIDSCGTKIVYGGMESVMRIGAFS